MLRAEFKNFSLNAEYFPQPLRRNAEFGVRRPPPGAAAGAGGVDDKTGVVFVLDILYGLYVKNVQPFRPFFNAPEPFFVYVVCPNQPVVVQERAERQRFSACSGAIFYDAP